MYQLGGISKLVDLLRSPNQNVQQAATGALRNLVFRSTTNKLETRRQGGIREAVSLLRSTRSTEIQKQLTGREPGHGGQGCSVGCPSGWAKHRCRQSPGHPRQQLWPGSRCPDGDPGHCACTRGGQGLLEDSGQGLEAGVLVRSLFSRPWVQEVKGTGTNPSSASTLVQNTR